MEWGKLEIGGREWPFLRLGAVVVGTGAAGYSAALALQQEGIEDIAVISEGRLFGTSRNTGSDKQTYYKLTLAGDEPDDVQAMAETLFAGGCVDGDNALCEAALSTECFFRLVGLGVPFPRDRYGQYVGYKTDHDPRQRATSVGPYTSREMTERLEAAVLEKGVPLLDGLLLVRILTVDGRAVGLVCLDVKACRAGRAEYRLIGCGSVVLATGGPAGLYAGTVYPHSQHGANGLAFEAGAAGQNLTEWQFGLASVAPRWNVSGSYMQVVPRFYSCLPDGSDEREFLPEAVGAGAANDLVFLKGYQWPFDVRKAEDGSSRIDLAVYAEQCAGRRVFLDFRQNPGGAGVLDMAALSAEAREYLQRTGATGATPIERLLQMNAPAVEFYKDRGVDLAREPLEIALCAQHNNGGIAVDMWWQSGVKGLFVAGEAAGTHGVYRPGGSALNAGQVGSVRAAQYIAHRGGAALAADAFAGAVAEAVLEMEAFWQVGGEAAVDVEAALREAQKAMSETAAVKRDTQALKGLLADVEGKLAGLAGAGVAGAALLPVACKLRETLLCQRVYLTAMIDYAERGGESRGSAMVLGAAKGAPPQGIQMVRYTAGRCEAEWRAPRPLPREDEAFEAVWRGWRKDKNTR